MGRVGDPPITCSCDTCESSQTPKFKDWQTDTVSWTNAQGQTKYQPAVWESGGDRLTYQTKSWYSHISEEWDEPKEREWPVLYRSQQRAEKKARKWIVRRNKSLWKKT